MKIALLLAIALDWLLGEPPNRYHPVAWMGQFLHEAQRYRPHDNPLAEFGFGAMLTLFGVTMAALIGWFWLRLTAVFPPSLGALSEAILLTTTFSIRGLWQSSGEVQASLEQDDLPEARHLLAWHLVSRDTSPLTDSQVAAAAIESVAENCSDSVTAPLLAYAVGGLPLALAYRFINMADAMLGYRDSAREWLGKFPARLDDVLNIVPARLTGLLLVMVGGLMGNGHRAAHIMRRDAAQTDSPNAGYPMSAMAGALGVELEKVGQYRLGEGLRPPRTADIARSRFYFLAVVGMVIGIVLAMGSARKGKR